MDTQETRARLADERPVVVQHDAVPAGLERSVVVDPPAPPRQGPGLRRAVLAGLAIGVLVAAALGGWLAGRGDEAVTTTPAAPAPAAPAGLSLEVTAPTHVVAGRAATLVVTYADGAGTFSGSTEEWGDGVGTSSLREASCGVGAADAPASGTYRTRHTWAVAGTYAVKVAVSSYTCGSGTPVEEQAATTVTVVVDAP
ncbi:MAG: hypothetical protein ABI807_00465 [Sporichthyaceae bacterium]